MGAGLSLASGLIFASLVVVAASAGLRRRDPLARDVALVFLPLAVLFLLSIAELLVGPAPVPLAVAAVLLLVAQPLFALRLVADLRALPRWLLRMAALGLAAAVLVLFAAGAAHRTLGAVVLVIAFVSLEALAAFYFAEEAAHSRGGSRARLGVASFATAAFAAAILAAGAAAALPGAAAVATASAQVVALVAALGYVVAFLPPAWLRRAWQASAGLSFLERLAAVSPSEPEDALWGRLAAAARDLGATAAAVLVASEEGVRVAAAAGPGIELGLTYPAGAPAGDGRGCGDEDAIRRDLLMRSATRFATTVPIPAGAGRSGSLIVLTSHARLFGADDADLLSVLAAQIGALVERRGALAEQEQLSARLGDTVEALRRASAAKSDFLASMSHELRTPLNAIIGFAELMRESQPAEGQVAVPLEWVEHVYTSGGHLLDLINDVLDLSKVEAGRLELVPDWVDVPTAVAESIGGLRPLAERKQLGLDVDAAPGLVQADRGRLRQVLYNLLSNAIKYTPPGGSIRVSTTQAAGELRISVADTGIGIAPEDQARVFEEFRQVGDPALRQDGTGLGLALTRRLVEAHRGHVELVSVPGEGSTFTVVLPLASDGPAPPAAPRASASGGGVRSGAAGADVLIIEDDPGAVRLLRTYLETAGYHVRVASDGEGGLAQASRTPPGAILLDVLLPGMDGWDVLRALKADETLREVPVIIVTVVDERGVGLALGAADYFLKPVDRETLLARLGRYTFTTKVRRGPVHVLAVDDDPASLALVDAALTPEGFTVTGVTSGRAALELAVRHPFDLVICDLVMPGLSGFDVVAALQADPRTRDAVILILTAYELNETEKARLNGHVAGIVDKGTGAADGLRAWLARALPPRPIGVGEG